MPRFDLAIVGGGPAGTAAGWWAARRGLAVAIYERGVYPRDKVCGEFISPEALPLLREMAPGALVGAAEIRRADFSGRRGVAHGFALLHPAIGVSRQRLDVALWRAAGKAGCRLFDGATIGSLEELDAGAVIVAAGRWWRIQGLEAPAAGEWVGVKCRFGGLAPGEAVEMFLFPGGYCGVAPVEGGLVNACCLVHRRLMASAGSAPQDFAAWITAVSRHAGLERRLRDGVQATATVVTAPVRLGAAGAGAGAALTAGDACGFIDPYAGDGIARALLIGQLAAEAVATGDVDSYAWRLRQATGGGWGAAGLLRRLVEAPALAQAAAVWALARPGIGGRVVAATRWQVEKARP